MGCSSPLFKAADAYMQRGRRMQEPFAVSPCIYGTIHERNDLQLLTSSAEFVSMSTVLSNN